jgi:predicted GIY-YIG superfamily endonuclease
LSLCRTGGRLVYYEFHESIRDAIARETQIKGWRREKKVALIDSMNPRWRGVAERQRFLDKLGMTIQPHFFF